MAKAWRYIAFTDDLETETTPTGNVLEAAAQTTSTREKPFTPLDGLYPSWTLPAAARALQKRHPINHRRAAWYANPPTTFVDAIGLVRHPPVAGVGEFINVGRRS